jgi:hypothetical protein
LSDVHSLVAVVVVVSVDAGMAPDLLGYLVKVGGCCLALELQPSRGMLDIFPTHIRNCVGMRLAADVDRSGLWLLDLSARLYVAGFRRLERLLGRLFCESSSIVVFHLAAGGPVSRIRAAVDEGKRFP